jgi:hypothetical protein
LDYESLQDTKHTLKIIENINEKIDKQEFSLDGVGLLTLDIEKFHFSRGQKMKQNNL